MNNYLKFAIVGSFFSLWIASFLSHQIQLILGFLLIFTFGIMHGANDIVLIKSINKTSKTKSFFKILCYYIVFVLLGLFAFYVYPLISLLLFIIASGYHFGEQHWEHIDYIKTELKIVINIIYGTFILLLLFYFHQTEVKEIVFAITNFNISLSIIPLLLKIFTVLLVGAFGVLFYKYSEIKEQLFLEIFYLAVFAIIFATSGLIWSFAIYFIIWHSIPSIIDQIKFIYGDNNLKNQKLYLKSGFLYWLFSLIGIALLYVLFKDEKIFNALFFSFLAAITFPHVLVILKMFGKNKPNE